MHKTGNEHPLLFLFSLLTGLIAIIHCSIAPLSFTHTNTHTHHCNYCNVNLVGNFWKVVPVGIDEAGSKGHTERVGRRSCTRARQISAHPGIHCLGREGPISPATTKLSWPLDCLYTWHKRIFEQHLVFSSYWVYTSRCFRGWKVVNCRFACHCKVTVLYMPQFREMMWRLIDLCLCLSAPSHAHHKNYDVADEQRWGLISSICSSSCMVNLNL